MQGMHLMGYATNIQLDNDMTNTHAITGHAVRKQLVALITMTSSVCDHSQEFVQLS